MRITGPGTAYAYVYDERNIDLNKIAYDFEYETDWKVDPSLYEELVRITNDWKVRYFSDNRPFLFYSKAMSYITIFDGRNSTPTSERFDWPASFIIEFCNEVPKTFDQIQKGADVPINDILESMVTKQILYEEKGRYFTLALPVNPHL
jgi:hypothetical protein